MAQHAPAGATGDSIRANAAFSFAVKMITAAFTAGSTVFLARHLGPAEFGLFALAMSVAALLILPSDFGLSSSAARFIAERHGDGPRTAQVLADALLLKLVASVVVCGGLVALASPIAQAYDEPGLTWPLRGISLALLGQNLMMLYINAFSAMRRVSLQLRVVLTESAVEAAATVALVLMAGGASAAAFGRGVGYLVGAVAAIAVATRLLGRGIWPRTWRPTMGRRLAGYAGSLFLIDASFTLFTQIDILLIGAFLGAAEVGLFQAPLRLAAFLHYPGLAAASAITPRMARTSTEGPNVRALADGLRILIILQTGIAVGIAVWAGPIAQLALGDAYGESATVLRAMAGYIFLSGLAPLVSLAVNYSGSAARRLPIALASLTLNVVIDVLLIPRIGVVAGAIGTTAAFLVYVPAHLWLCRQIFGLQLRPLARTFGRSLVAAVPLAGVLALCGTTRLSASGWLLGIVGGTVVYAAGLLATRAIRRDEVAAILAKRPRRRG